MKKCRIATLRLRTKEDDLVKNNELVAALEIYVKESPMVMLSRELDACGAEVLETKETQGKNTVVTNALVSPSWVIGGVQGGSCYGGRANTPVSADPRPNWLEDILEKVAPNASFAQYRKLNALRKRYEYSELGYYSNSTIYAFEVIYLEDVRKTFHD